jgi:hypothetical protein
MTRPLDTWSWSTGARWETWMKLTPPETPRRWASTLRVSRGIDEE